MDLTKHKEVMANCESKAEYFKNLDFTNIAETFTKAAESMKELVGVLEKLNELTDEAPADGQ